MKIETTIAIVREQLLASVDPSDVPRAARTGPPSGQHRRTCSSPALLDICINFNNSAYMFDLLGIEILMRIISKASPEFRFGGDHSAKKTLLNFF